MEDKPEAILLDGVLDSLEDIGYSGPLQDSNTLQSAIEQGLSSPLFTDLCTSLCSELKQLHGLQESVSQPQGQEDSESFLLEVRSFLKELHCPHPSLTNDRDLLTSYRKKLLMVDFLLSEALTARLLSLKKREREKMEVGDGGDSSRSVRANLEAILNVYAINHPPPHVTVRQVLERIIGKTREVLSRCPVGDPLVTTPLSGEQWSTLGEINEALVQEYSVRRRMLLTRCDVTVQSFRWSDRIKGKKEEFSEVYQAHRQLLRESAPVGVARVLAAREDLLEIEKTNSIAVRSGTQCDINKILIGKVPDRGGRPRETRPPPEMPAFRKRTEVPQDQRSGGGRGQGGKGGRGGGRVQGGWAGGGHKGGGGGWHQKSGGRHGYASGGGGGQHQQYHS